MVFQEKRLRNHATDTARSEQTDQRSKEMDEKNHQMTRRRIVAGEGSWGIRTHQTGGDTC